MKSAYICYYASNQPSYPKSLCGKCNHFEKCFDFLFKKKNMETKEVKIEIPEGYEIDESKSSFEKIVFKKKEKKLPKTWGQLQTSGYREPTILVSTENWISGVSKKYFDKLIVLSKLLELRDVYNDGWEPDWNDDNEKYSIFPCGKGIELFTRNTHSCILTFKSRELRDEFYNNFKDLIEQAKELL